jgi:hypothetical protein
MLTFRGPDEGHSRSASCSLSEIFVFLLSRNDNQSINQAYNVALRSKTKECIGSNTE